MRFSLAILLAPFLASSIVTARFNIPNKRAPNPQPGQDGIALQQVTRKELELRAKYPDMFFGKNKRDSTTSNTVCNNPGRRRSAQNHYILNAQEAAAFLMGHGTFTHNNGSIYHDADYRQSLKLKSRSVPQNRGMYSVVKDKLGNKLLGISIPIYKHWKAHVNPNNLIHLSPNSAISVADASAIEQELLADPNFDELQILGFKVSRQFFEILNSY